MDSLRVLHSGLLLTLVLAIDLVLQTIGNSLVFWVTLKCTNLISKRWAWAVVLAKGNFF